MEHAETMHLFLPEPAYDLWVAGELNEVLGVPDDGTRVEIIGGEIVVSPLPYFEHAVIANEIQDLFAVAAATRSPFPRRMMQVVGLNVAGVRDGYIPDLLCLEAETYAQLRAKKSTVVLPEHVALAIEITSPSNAADDREPGPHRRRLTKWSGYAHEVIPFYLLIDRDPKVARATLYSDPDPVEGRYRASTSWPFGDPIELPAPFDIEIPTATWQVWDS